MIFQSSLYCVPDKLLSFLYIFLLFFHLGTTFLFPHICCFFGYALDRTAMTPSLNGVGFHSRCLVGHSGVVSRMSHVCVIGASGIIMS